MKKSIIVSSLIYLFSIAFIIFIIPLLSEKIAKSSLTQSSTIYEIYHELDTKSSQQTQQEEPTEYLEEGEEKQPESTKKLKTSKPFVSIVIDDYGYFVNDTVTLSLTSEIPITVAIIPFQEYSKDIFSLAKKYNKEVIVHMPMETIKKKLNIKPYISTKMSDNEIIKLLDEAFNEIDGIGLNNHMGSLATADERVMTTVLRYLSSRGKIFLDSLTTINSVTPRVAKQYGIHILVRDVFIDNNSSEYYILSQLERVKEVATQKGYCIAIGHIRPNTISTLLKWYEENKENFNFVSLSYIKNVISQIQ
jgi:polysaccharide deacetylase 2 family uncharacterized protein YibQ